MTFLSPDRLLLLLAVAGLAVAYVVMQARRRRYAVRFSNLELLGSVAPKRPGWRRHVAAVGVALGLVAMIIGLARPVRNEQVPRETATVMLAVDVSASMTAGDVAPTRLAAAQAAATKFVADLPSGFQVGLVAFNKSARLVTSPTTDHASVEAAIEALTTGPGTAAGEGIYTALDAIHDVQATTTPIASADATTTTTTSSTGSTKDPVATIVLISDGATTAGRSVETAAATAKDQGVPVTAIAYGTADGTVTIDGQTMAVPADTAALEQVAQISGGEYYQAASGSELSSVYKTIQSRVGFVTEPQEILRFFVGLGVVLLLLAVGASMVWTGRFL